MSRREIVHTALLLGGIWIVIEGAASLAPSIAGFAGINSSISDSDLLDTVLLPAAVSVVAFGIFSLLPGYFVIDRSERWARSLFPERADPVELRPSVLFAAGAMLFGVVWMVKGAILLPISAIQLSFYYASEFPTPMMESAVVSGTTGLLWIVAGLLLYRYGARLAVHAV